MEQTRMRSGWRQEEIDCLRQEVRKAAEEKAPLRGVFERMGEQLNRKPNSVRNYYYMQMRSQTEEPYQRARPFETFTEEEIHDLVREVLLSRGKGESVRACVMRMSQGDKSKMLRLQNKYRAVLHKKPDLICEIAEELTSEGLPCFNPVAGFTQAKEKAPQQWEDQDVQQLMLAAESLMRRMAECDPKGDRMRVQRDVCMMQLEDLQKAAGELVQVCKELCAGELSLPHCALCRDELIEKLTKVENLCG